MLKFPDSFALSSTPGFCSFLTCAAPPSSARGSWCGVVRISSTPHFPRRLSVSQPSTVFVPTPFRPGLVSSGLSRSSPLWLPVASETQSSYPPDCPPVRTSSLVLPSGPSLRWGGRPRTPVRMSRRRVGYDPTDRGGRKVPVEPGWTPRQTGWVGASRSGSVW